jgi:5-methylcytosine-specific restriction endonuclease McrA
VPKGGVHHPRRVLASLRRRDGDNCSICGLPMDFTLPRAHRRAPTIEHVIPRAAGGSSRLPNLRLAHAYPCNHEKGATHNGRDFGLPASPYGIGKKNRSRLGDWPRDRHGDWYPPGPPADGSQDWDTPVLPCWP